MSTEDHGHTMAPTLTKPADRVERWRAYRDTDYRTAPFQDELNRALDVAEANAVEAIAAGEPHEALMWAVLGVAAELRVAGLRR